MKLTLPLFAMTLTCLFSQCDPRSHSDKDLSGKKEGEILKLYESTYSTRFFLLSDSIQDYEQRLLQLFPRYKTDTIRIKELIWEEDKKTTVFWLIEKNRQWVVAADTSWKADKAKPGL